MMFIRLFISFIKQTSMDSERDEDSEDTASRTGSHTDHTDSRSDLHWGEVSDSLPSPLRDFNQPYEPVYEKPWGPGGKVSPSPQRSPAPHSPHSPKSPRLSSQVHQFLVKSFQSPYKCNLCSSLLVGLQRQGITCES